ncbi:hypothetical protein ABZ281_32875, partial [Streptomyces sp. NPDC006265]|uniref:hypothetical protein n=1 Tax=Streptomyces sp. NPDC006265 TaxID=3156740 RepID=UPI0033A3052E
ATRKRAGAPHPPAERGDVERIAARLRATMDEAAYDREFTAGTVRDHESEAAVESAVRPETW